MTDEPKNPRSPRNTAKDSPEYLLDALLVNPSRGIEEMEKNGQREMVDSEVLPTEIIGGTREEMAKMGVVYGAPAEGDKLFTQVTLPEGWTRKESAHDMHSHVLDTKGRERLHIFYKAAFYDRRAHVSIVSRYENHYTDERSAQGPYIVEVRDRVTGDILARGTSSEIDKDPVVDKLWTRADGKRKTAAETWEGVS